MIPRLTGYRHGAPRWNDWSDDDAMTFGAHLFESRRPLRDLVVMVDFELLDPVVDPADLRPPSIATDLVLRHPLVSAFAYLDPGTEGNKRLPEVLSVAEDTEVRSVRVGPVPTDSDPLRGREVRLKVNDGGDMWTGVSGNAVDVAARDEKTEAYEGLDPLAASERRAADALAFSVAKQAVEADLYITDREYLHRAVWLVDDGPTVLRPRDALAAVGLYLRAQDAYCATHWLNFDRSLYLWVAARDALPGGWRWRGACFDAARADPELEQLEALTGVLFQRITRFLGSRDDVHVALNLRRGARRVEAALESLDVALLMLMAAFDVTARVAHHVMGLSSKSVRAAGWQNDSWRSNIAEQQPALAAIFDDGSAGRTVLDVVRILRNSIHGEALEGVEFSDGTNASMLVLLPPADSAKVLSAMEQDGGAAAWGLTAIQPGRSHIDPGVLVDRIAERALPVIDAVLAATPVEVLGGDPSNPGWREPEPAAAGKPPTVWDPWVRTSIRWQLGL